MLSNRKNIQTVVSFMKIRPFMRTIFVRHVLTLAENLFATSHQNNLYP